MVVTDPTYETRAARRARLARESAQRSREWRQKQREQLVPDTRATAAGIAEAVQFLALKNSTVQNSLPGASGASMTVKQIVTAASLCLRRQGYGYLAAQRRVIAMLQPTTDHCGPCSVPTKDHVPGPAALHPPRFAKSWSRLEINAMRRIMSVGQAETVYDVLAAETLNVLRDVE